MTLAYEKCPRKGSASPQPHQRESDQGSNPSTDRLERSRQILEHNATRNKCCRSAGAGLTRYARQHFLSTIDLDVTKQEPHGNCDHQRLGGLQTGMETSSKGGRIDMSPEDDNNEVCTQRYWCSGTGTPHGKNALPVLAPTPGLLSATMFLVP